MVLMKVALYTIVLIAVIGLAGMIVINDARAQAGWYDADWQYRQQITIDADQVDSSLSNFPIYVDLSNLGSPFFSNANNDCGDIRVTESDGTTEVAREVVACDISGETGEIHFKAPTVSSSSDTSFYVYYGNGSASDYSDSATYGTENVWTNSFTGVWHLQVSGSGSLDEYKDSTANAYDGQGGGGSGSAIPSQTTGQISSGQSFDDSNDYIAIADNNYSSASALPQMTVMAWASIPSNGGDWSIVDYDRSEYFTCAAGVPDGSFSGEGDYVGYHTNSSDINDMWGNTDIRDGSWHHIGCVYDGTDKLIYADGAQDGVTTNPHSGSALGSGTTRYGFLGDGSEASSFDGSKNDIYYDGQMDEVRFSSVARSSSWFDATYTNQNTPTTFYSVASQETQTAGDPELSSSNYSVVRSSINSGGRDQVSSANYQVADTVGEQATGESDSSNYQVQAGYRQMRSSNIAISAQQDINLGSFGGVDGGAAEATPAMNVITDNEAGYELSVQSSSSPAMQNTTAGGSFADYNAGTDPDYTFSVSASSSAFGFSPEGPDVTQAYQDNGSSCNTGSQENSSRCWRGFTISDQLIARSGDNNQPDGATTTLRLRAESGADNIQTAGTYEATITVTAVAI